METTITTLQNKVTKTHNVRRYSQIDDLSPALQLQACFGLAVIVAHDQKEGHVVHDESDLLTVREVAQQLRVDDTTVRRWIKNGVLEAISLPHRGSRQAYRIRRATLEALLSPQQPPTNNK